MLMLVLLAVLHISIRGVVNYTMEGQKREAHTFSLEKASPSLSSVSADDHIRRIHPTAQQPLQNPKQNGDLQTRWKFIAPRGGPS